MINPIPILTKKWWQFSKGNRKNVVLYVSLFLIGQTIYFFEPLVIGLLLNTIQQEGLDRIGYILGIASLYVIIKFLFWVFHGPARVIEIANAFHVRATYKEYLTEGVLRLPTKWHTDHHSGDTIDKIEKGTQAMFSFSQITFEIIDTVMRFLGSYIALIYFDFHASYIVLCFVVLTLLTIMKFDKYIVPKYKFINKLENIVAAKVYDVISNITTVIILRIEKLVMSDIVKAIQKPFAMFHKSNILNETKWFVVSMFTGLMVFAVLGSYLFQSYITGNTLLLGNIYILFGYVERINNLFYRFAYRYGEMVKQAADISNAQIIEDVFEKYPKIKKTKLSQWKQLHINNLSFSYDGSSQLHLNDVSLTIAKGEKIAFIGESGSGKTTMLKVLRGLYQSPSYNLVIDKTHIKGGLKSIQHEMALIPQDPEIFNASIKENITFGLKFTMKRILTYTNMARFTKVANTLPHKWDSLIVEKGVNLSGGEKQRLALARGLLHCEKKQFILLDEPTSSVDPENELFIYKKILKHFKKKTVVSTLHRLHLLPLFDTIYVFDKGKIAVSGSYMNLKKNSALFRRLLKKKELD